MGPAIYCALCFGPHPEGLHFTVRGTLAPEPVTAPAAGGESGSTAHPALLAEQEVLPPRPVSRRAASPR
jgi:hypothetical protein